VVNVMDDMEVFQERRSISSRTQLFAVGDRRVLNKSGQRCMSRAAQTQAVLSSSNSEEQEQGRIWGRRVSTDGCREECTKGGLTTGRVSNCGI
jgi:hypothetical protein